MPSRRERAERHSAPLAWMLCKSRQCHPGATAGVWQISLKCGDYLKQPEQSIVRRS